MLGGLQSRSGSGGGENFLLLPEIESQSSVIDYVPSSSVPLSDAPQYNINAREDAFASRNVLRLAVMSVM